MLYIPSLVIQEIQQRFEIAISDLVGDFQRDLLSLDFQRKKLTDAYLYDRQRLEMAYQHEMGGA